MFLYTRIKRFVEEALKNTTIPYLTIRRAGADARIPIGLEKPKLE